MITPPPLNFSPVLISTPLANHATHSIHFASPFQSPNAKRDAFRGWWGEQEGVGRFSQKYQWLYNSITALAERERQNEKGIFCLRFLLFPAAYYQKWIKVSASLTLRMSSLKQPARDPHPSRSSCLILLSDLLCDLLWMMGGSFCLDIPAQQL